MERGVSPIYVEVRDEPSKLAELARKVPKAVRRRPIWIGLGMVTLAFMPSPLLLLAFSLPTVAAIWVAGFAFVAIILFSVEQEVPTAGLTPGRITIDEHAATIERETQTDRWRSSAVRDVQVLTDAIVLLSHHEGWLVIPRASFDSPETCERFITAARALLDADQPTASWPKPSPLQLGPIAFLLTLAGGLGWLAWDASFWLRLVCAPLAGICITLSTADMNGSSRRLMGRKPGRPIPPRPGDSADAYVVAVRIETLRPSVLLVLGVYVLAAALLYVTLAAGMIGNVIFVLLAWVVLAFATFELLSVFEMWWPWRPVRSWRQIEASPLAVARRYADSSVTVTWTKLAEPIVRDGAIFLKRPDGGTFETIASGDFAQPQDRDAFIAVARPIADR